MGSTKLMNASEFAKNSKTLLQPYGPDAEGNPRKATVTQANYWARKNEVANAQPVGAGSRRQYVAPVEDWIEAALVQRAPGVKGAALPPDDVIKAEIAKKTPVREIAKKHGGTYSTIYRYAIRQGWLKRNTKARG